ncbi:PucR family transcriptional regulator [Halostreptopolyspora alba]|uniref:PucR family transcriptional regulator n=1 Tax=Halostreptopolyspora alba TaxID=2487137 RepID=A0A3N0E245_9ACTN|nr:PucR family transcriptional regulator [Nocardiopsaceae bacterium YIM 96095]
MQISELLASPHLDLRFLRGAGHAHGSIRWACTTELLDPRRYLRGGELVLTTMVWRSGAEDSETFVSSLDEAGVACLAVGTALGSVPADLIEACERHDMPLIEVPAETSFGVVTEEVMRLTHQRASSIAETRDRHRRLMVEVASGTDFPEVFAETAVEAGIRAWVVSSTGRLVASSGEDLPGADRERLVSRVLGWSSFPRATELPASPGTEGATVTVFPVQTRESHPLTGWLVGCVGDHTQWSEETHEAVAELVSIAVLARSRVEERWLSDTRHAAELPKLLDARRLDEVGALLRAAAGPESTDRVRWGYVAVSASLQPEPRLPDLARRIVSELVAEWPGTVVAGENETLAVVPVSRGGQEGTSAAERLCTEITRGTRVLEPGLDEYRLAVGISSTALDVAELRGAAVEARHACHLAQLREGRSRVTTAAEIDSHELLLASVPEEVRTSYRDRLLGPLVEYDRHHRSELVRTLERFLAHSGAWQRCAAAMHVHVNTLRYRIGRVEELTGRDLSSLEHRVDLFLALRLRS